MPPKKKKKLPSAHPYFILTEAENLCVGFCYHPYFIDVKTDVGRG